MLLLTRKFEVKIKIMYKNENIVVVKSSKFNLWNGFIEKDLSIIKTIEDQFEIYPRNLAEEDINFKQIIPYMIFKYKNKIFLMNRGSKPGEKRLADKYSIGIGGHIILEDTDKKNLLEWGIREFHEEINYTDDFNIKIIGFINDNNSIIGKVHLGIAILIEGETDNISIKSELKSGELIEFEALEKYFEKMEYWSQEIYLYFKKQK